jgi:TRAP-type transport system periplasmic protein
MKHRCKHANAVRPAPVASSRRSAPRTFARSSRRQLLLGAAALLATSRLGRAGESHYRLGSNQPVGSPIHRSLTQMVDRIREETQGRMQIDLYPACQLGSDSAMLASVQNNTLDFYLAGNVLGPIVPITELPGLPFTFKSSAEVFEALDGELGNYIRRELAIKGIHAFPYCFENGFHQITTSTKLIRGADDLVDLKIRTPIQKMTVDFFESLGARPMTFTFDRLYSVLKDHTVDAQTDPLMVVEVLKLYEVQTYLSLTNHWWSGFTLIANVDAWQAIPPDLQAIISRCAESAALLQRRDIDAVNSSGLMSLLEKGMIVNQTDTSGFRGQLQPFYERWKANYGTTAWALLEDRVGRLT